MSREPEARCYWVGPEDARRRLDQILFDRVAWLSRMRIRAAIRDGAVLLNGARADSGMRVAAGDRIEARLDASRPSAMFPEAMELRLAHDAGDWVVIDKPAGLLVHPTLKVKSGTLLNGLVALWNAPGEPLVRPILVNRLDQGTSGLVVAAKTAAAGRLLGNALAAGLFHKRYTAILDGLLDGDRMEGDRIEIDAPIARTSELEPHWRACADGKPALTRLKALERKQSRTLVELEPVTGRTNQLRIHCAHIGRPIVGDRAYGGSHAERLCLHAH